MAEMLERFTFSWEFVEDGEVLASHKSVVKQDCEGATDLDEVIYEFYRLLEYEYSKETLDKAFTSFGKDCQESIDESASAGICSWKFADDEDCDCDKDYDCEYCDCNDECDLHDEELSCCPAPEYNVEEPEEESKDNDENPAPWCPKRMCHCWFWHKLNGCYAREENCDMKTDCPVRAVNGGGYSGKAHCEDCIYYELEEHMCYNKAITGCNAMRVETSSNNSNSFNTIRLEVVED